MKKNSKKSDASSLRQKATEQLKKQKSNKSSILSEIETQKLIHELEVHQIELEMQNEELFLAKELAEKATEKYTDLYNFAPSGYITLSKDGSIMELNFSAARMLGKERSNLIDNAFAFFISEDTRNLFNSFFEKLFVSKIKETCEVVLSIKECTLLYMHIDGIVSENSEQCYLTLVDITERKLAEYAILESQRLSVVGEMASAVAHDFNNSLQAILSTLTVAMLKIDVPEPTIKFLENIESMILEVAERVKLLQRYGEKNQSKTNCSLLNLNTLIEESIKQLSPLWRNEAEKKGLSIKINTKLIPLTIVNGNKCEIKSVLLNIIKNCLEALPNGGVIDIETGFKTEGIYLTITDSGIGMNNETKIRMFQPFFTTKGFDVGRGLGMSGVYSIIKEHGGNVFVKNSELGKGTAIEVVFPIPEQKEITNEKSIEEVITKNDLELRILLVEDDDLIRENICFIIEQLGHKCDTANSGKKALEFLDKNKYDIVITDIGIPNMNGWQLADKINEKFGDKIKVAVISGWSSEISEEEEKKHGVTHVLGKPFTIEQLENLIFEISKSEI